MQRLTLALVATLAGCCTVAVVARFGRLRGAKLGHALGFKSGRMPCANTVKFLFRFVAGLYFTALYVFRGFGIAVGAHAAYDILVSVSVESIRGCHLVIDGMCSSPELNLIARMSSCHVCLRRLATSFSVTQWCRVPASLPCRVVRTVWRCCTA